LKKSASLNVIGRKFFRLTPATEADAKKDANGWFVGLARGGTGRAIINLPLQKETKREKTRVLSDESGSTTQT
jgi:hypothetical protein